ncbi:hypothetical protein MRB53_039945 [Persea americana]|nr:hypothetical protein MRB53_039945 [Persea americana]
MKSRESEPSTSSPAHRHAAVIHTHNTHAATTLLPSCANSPVQRCQSQYCKINLNAYASSQSRRVRLRDACAAAHRAQLLAALECFL